MAHRTGDGDGGPTVVFVADEEPADRYAPWLEDRWSVAVTSGAGALSGLASEPDVVVLDRGVSGIHADRLLGIVREREIDTRVVMLTEVEPGSNPLRLGFDDYLVKPVSESELVESVESGLRRAAYERELSRFYELAAERAELTSNRSEAELAEDERYQRLESELSAVRSAVADAFARLDGDDVTKLCTELSRRSEGPDDVLSEV